MFLPALASILINFNAVGTGYPYTLLKGFDTSAIDRET